MARFVDSVRQFAEERVGDDLRERLVQNYETAKARVTKRDEEGKLIIAMEPVTLLQVIGAITVGWCALRILGWLAPVLWKLRWVLVGVGIAVGLWRLTKSDA